MAEYTEAQLDRIAKDIVQQSTASRRASQTYLSGKFVHEDWDPQAFMSELYDQWLQVVQQGKVLRTDQGNPLSPVKKVYGPDSTFEEYLQDCKATLTWRREELSRELSMSVIDERTYNNAKAIADAAEEAIAHFLEKPASAQLIGV